jgi:sugar phosphate isomerase/epimerase
MNRRRFVVGTAVTAGGHAAWRALGLPLSLPERPPTRRLERIGLELYSVRDAMKRNPERTMAAVREIGYREVELLWSFGNFGRTPREVKRTLDAEGLLAPSAHIDPRLLLGDWAKALEDAALLGHDSLIAPSIPGEAARTLDGWRSWADRFNEAGERARAAGIWLAFHNEPSHQRAIDGVIPYDLFLARTQPTLVRHQLDVGNMTMGGGDPLPYLRRHGDRYWSFHLKDVTSDRSRDTELGEGNVPLRQILAAIPEIDRKPCYVEQEGSDDPMESARRNFEYLRTLEF